MVVAESMWLLKAGVCLVCLCISLEHVLAIGSLLRIWCMQVRKEGEKPKVYLLALNKLLENCMTCTSLKYNYVACKNISCYKE